MTTNKVIIVKPERLAGVVAHKNGDRFRYPSQNFWVQPVVLENGQKELALQVEDLPLNNKVAADYINGFLDSKIILNTDPKIVYDYFDLLNQARCPSCGMTMGWINEPIKDKSDKVCYAECCGMQYSMVPEKVRVISVPVASLKEKIVEAFSHQDDRVCDDSDFLSELERLR